MTADYLTLAEALDDLGIGDAADDDSVARAISAASRAIDNWCGQRFWKDDADTVRYLTASSPRSLSLLDAVDVESRALVSVTSVELDVAGDGSFGVSWTEDAEFFLSPRGASAADRPYDRLRPLQGRTFPTSPESVKVTGVFGWPEVPDAVKEACAIQAGTLFKRVTEGAAPIVTAEGTTLHSSKFLDYTAQLLLAPYRLPVVM